MAIVTGIRAKTPADYRKLVKVFLRNNPDLLSLWERHAKKKDATEHVKNLAKYGREYAG